MRQTPASPPPTVEPPVEAPAASWPPLMLVRE
jgi:hypothetical protein